MKKTVKAAIAVVAALFALSFASCSYDDAIAASAGGSEQGGSQQGGSQQGGSQQGGSQQGGSSTGSTLDATTAYTCTYQGLPSELASSVPTGPMTGAQWNLLISQYGLSASDYSVSGTVITVNSDGTSKILRAMQVQ